MPRDLGEEVPCRTRRPVAGPGLSEIAPWADDQTRQHLQVLVESVATLAGFEQSAITLRRATTSWSSSRPGVPDGFAGTRVPLSAMQAEMDRRRRLGCVAFVHHDRVSAEVLPYSHIPDVVPLDVADAWHPLDMLFAPLHDDEGVLRGLLVRRQPPQRPAAGTGAARRADAVRRRRAHAACCSRSSARA